MVISTMSTNKLYRTTKYRFSNYENKMKSNPLTSWKQSSNGEAVTQLIMRSSLVAISQCSVSCLSSVSLLCSRVYRFILFCYYYFLVFHSLSFCFLALVSLLYTLSPQTLGMISMLHSFCQRYMKSNIFQLERFK